MITALFTFTSGSRISCFPISTKINIITAFCLICLSSEGYVLAASKCLLLIRGKGMKTERGRMRTVERGKRGSSFSYSSLGSLAVNFPGKSLPTNWENSSLGGTNIILHMGNCTFKSELLFASQLSRRQEYFLKASLQ